MNRGGRLLVVRSPNTPSCQSEVLEKLIVGPPSWAEIRDVVRLEWSRSLGTKPPHGERPGRQTALCADREAAQLRDSMGRYRQPS